MSANTIAVVALYVLAVVYAFGETAYFGNHLAPQSAAEIIADGITTLLCALAILGSIIAGGSHHG